MEVVKTNKRNKSNKNNGKGNKSELRDNKTNKTKVLLVYYLPLQFVTFSIVCVALSCACFYMLFIPFILSHARAHSHMQTRVC